MLTSKAPSIFKITIALLCVTFLGICHADDDPLIFSTNECSLTEPVYSHKFDFSVLHSDFGHQAISDNGDVFNYNICGNLTKSCDGQSNVAACLKRGDKEYALGIQQQLNYHNGRMYFTFSNGSKCPFGNDDFQLHVFIGCDYTLDKNQSQVTPYSEDACSFYIKLETPHACLPEPDNVKSNSCSVRDPNTGHTYDLLSLSDYNYRTTDRMGSAFVINVCKPVLYGENAMCPPGSSICYMSLRATNFKYKFSNYGTAQPNPVIENGKLLMRHTSNTRCNATSNYTSTINFYCDKDVKNAHPELNGVHGCNYEFTFATPLACDNLSPCTAIARGNEIVDMRPLKDHPFTLSMGNQNYTFAVCSAAGGSCLENDGACLVKNGQSMSLGRNSSDLRYNQSGASPYLLYEHGAPCQKSMNGNTSDSADTSTFWSTKIEFICSNNITKDTSNNKNNGKNNANIVTGPKIIETTNCQVLIHYQTPLACREQITCKAKAYVDHSEDGTGEEIVDLTPLISTTENYEARIDSAIGEQQVGKTTKFYLNVCRPLVPKFGLGCPGGSAACMAKLDSSSPTPEEEKSLGFPIASLVAINRTAAELRYLRGGPCPSDKNSQLSSGIEFYCDMRAGRGSPVLTAISDCHYQFIWRTNVICPPHMCKFNTESCEIINEDINMKYNLRRLPFSDEGKIKIPKESGEMTLNVCGMHRKAMTDYSQGVVNVFFVEKMPCGIDDRINVQIRLICSATSESNSFFSQYGECSLVYVQRTPDICSFLGLALPSGGNNGSAIATTTSSPPKSTTDPSGGAAGGGGGGGDDDNGNGNNPDSHPAERTGSIGAILAAILSLTCFISCFAVLAFSPARRNSLRRLFRRRSSSVRYSRVHSNEEANLLLEPNRDITDSDDDMLL